MPTPTTAWDVNSPAGTEAKALGDNRIREFKQQFEDLFSADHELPGAGQGNNWGFHNRVTCLEQTDLGTGAPGITLLGAETIGGKPELIYTDEDDNDIQLTKQGFLHLDQNRLTNNIGIVSRNFANNADIVILKLNVSDKVQIPDGAVLASAAAPAENAGIANKKYVDDQITAAVAGLSGGVTLADAQTITGQKTFSAQIVAPGGINMTGGTLSGGSLNRSTTGETANFNSGTTVTCPVGTYVIGGVKQGDGNFIRFVYAFL